MKKTLGKLIASVALTYSVVSAAPAWAIQSATNPMARQCQKLAAKQLKEDFAPTKKAAKLEQTSAL